ncbi:MAG: fumarate hydratase [Actinobacteria bacterium]|nr:fumarate hydratase [Actinomycetota bacterium]NBY15296.1 fumarate hydratase [Actinomycetota bacterium]
MVDFQYSEMLGATPPNPEFRLITTDGIATETLGNRTFLTISTETLEKVAYEAIHDISHYLRTDHLVQLRAIIDDPDASSNDRFVALDLLKNANVSAGGVLPMCQDTGTAIISAKRGSQVLTPGNDEEALSKGIYIAYQKLNLRYSQMSPVTMWDEKNTGSNLPAQIEIYSDTKPGHENEYEMLFIAKGGGSANKSFLYQETKAVLNPKRFMEFMSDKLRQIGTSACPPYHLAVVVGGTSAEYALKVAKLASTRYLDGMATSGGEFGIGFRDPNLEAQILQLTQQFGIGAQFGGKYFCHDVRVIRLPRHGASCPIAIAVSCSADRQAIVRINHSGAYIEKLDREPARFLPEITDTHLADDVVEIDLSQPMTKIQEQLSVCPVKTRLSLTGSLIVARDIAHARILEMLERGEELPQYFREYAVYYAGPAKTPVGYASGSFGPTTAGRMDSYVERFQELGGSMVMLAKGNRSEAVVKSCAKHGGFYLGSIGGPAAILATENITKVEVLDFADLGMEAVWKIDVVNFPAFVVIDDKGNDFYASTTRTFLNPVL